jgi:hypothetical protein
MVDLTQFIGRSAIIGIGATLVMDCWTLVRQHLLRGPGANYRLVGRWIGHLFRGRVRHAAIATSPPVRGELAIGWMTHYLTGIVFAAGLLAIWGTSWARAPTLIPALLVGITTVAAPFLIMQPAMGTGFAASRSPRPTQARLQSVVTHLVFGLGLYLSARLFTAWLQWQI